MKHFIFIIANIIAGAFALLSAWGGYVAPERWIIPSFAVMVFPVVALFILALLIVDLCFDRRSAIVPAVVMIVCAPQFFASFPVNVTARKEASALPSDRKFTFATYNVFDFSNLCRPDSALKPTPNPAISWIIAAAPDVICMQEVATIDAKVSSRIQVAQADSLRAIYPYRLMGEGLGVFSKYPICKAECPIMSRGSFSAQFYKLELPDSLTVHILNLHMQSLGLTPDDKALYREMASGETTKSELKQFKTSVASKLKAAFLERAQQAREVCEFLDSVGGTVIVCGDFNDVPGCYAETLIKRLGFEDNYAAGALGPTWTYNRERMYFRIDHIYYKGELEAIYTFTDRNRGSDHYPVMTVFEIITKK